MMSFDVSRISRRDVSIMVSMSDIVLKFRKRAFRSSDCAVRVAMCFSWKLVDVHVFQRSRKQLIIVMKFSLYESKIISWSSVEGVRHTEAIIVAISW